LALLSSCAWPASAAAAGTARVGFGLSPNVQVARVVEDAVLARLLQTYATKKDVEFVSLPLENAELHDQAATLEACRQHQLHALMQPLAVVETASAPDPPGVIVTVDLLVTDCSGAYFWSGRQTGKEPLTFDAQTGDVAASLQAQVKRMGSSMFDMLTAHFATFLVGTHRSAWENLLATGVPLDPADPAYHGMFTWATDGSQSRHVVSVFPGGPADRAQLHVGDIIDSIGGRSIHDLSNGEIQAILDATPNVTLVIERAGIASAISIPQEKAVDLIPKLKL
jgi:hypothetical protein